ncbi:MAG: glucose-1-phosphate thymidylyltransferase [Calditrichaeota bacterium]|nr:MAG: glucose-1-phosphate thymidylyltransferase [Calditrichota bacterium]
MARLGGPAVEKAAQLLQDGTLHFAGTLPRGQAGGEWEWIDYPWDLVRHNPAEVERDFDAELGKGRIDGQVSSHAVLVKQERIFVGKGSVVKAGVVVDASEGPVWLGQDVTVLPNAVILGPAYVGDHSVVKVGAKIYGGTSIGEVCKVGGEVEGSIIHSHSNKQHEGFLGHAYLGQWVNLGADTNNSDLKNNYGNVKVYVEGELVDSGSQFVGLFMGDHSKTGINTMFNTGTVVGVMSNVFGADFPPKFVPSFAWGGRAGLVEHELEKALQTARAVMARRAVEMSAAQERLFRRLFEMTRAERRGLQDLA